MKLYLFIALLWGLPLGSVWAELRVFACEPEWAALAGELGGEQLEVHSATTAYQDPHRIEARPSLIAKLRKADLLICSGAELEQGWLPLLLRKAGNAKVQPGQPGHVMAAEHVSRLDLPQVLDRSMGDVHGAGNPHVHFDPRRIAEVATLLNDRLQQLDGEASEYYQQRYEQFMVRWQSAIIEWQQLALPLKGVRVVVYHKDWRYLFDWLGIEQAATLEPKPGIAPSASHLALITSQLAENPARMVIYNSYQPERAARWLSRQANIPALQLPYTVGGSEKSVDLFSLFDEIITKLLAAL